MTSPSHTSPEHLLEELQLHQIELESQNEELRRMQIELIADRSRLDDLFELAPVGYCTVSEKGLMVQVNLAATNMLCAARRELVQQPLARFIRPEDQDVYYRHRRQLISTGEPQTCELGMVTREKVPFWALLSARIVKGDDGSALVLIALVDISERKRAAEMDTKKAAAEAANAAKSRFLAAASHDLRQPTHALGLFVERLGQLAHEPQARHLVTCLDASVRSLQDMLDALFDISRLDTDAVQVQVQVFPVGRIFEQLNSTFAAAASQKGIRLRFRPSGMWLRSDPVLLHSILLNLISNAIRYTQRGSVLVACRAGTGNSSGRIEVRDSGAGIAPQHHASIFDEFYQVGNVERNRSNGVGLGLNIVARTCRLLDHPLSMQSEVGCGTRFCLAVPRADALRSTEAPTQPPALTNSSVDGLQVLVIDDDAQGLAALSGLLESWGCSVTAAGGLRRACEACVTGAALPDVIISDYRLGEGENGVQVIRQLREMAGFPLAACLISGDSDDSVRQHVQAEGLVLLQKPVRPAKLRNLLRRMSEELQLT